MDSVGLKSQALAAWEAHAESWDGLMGDSGNKYFSVLELPILDRMALGRNGAYALDLATGNGLVARWLAQEGASVIATDGSRPMLEQAKARTESWYQQGKLNHDRKISFEVLDVMDPQCWDAFISRSLETCDGFDIITMNMALMDIPDLKPLAIALKRLLKPSAWSVLS
ncbi:hypothetical protein EYZ11_007801 [Aspergillus tanneri]|uniref:Methyltransferase domain-containing protein n=1 Tax=Aspergillus tanneri TaxID=1220188 RepID=A0A4V3UNW0_9EURO|nr:hypothetical protein EYZ11_007801 [Aspergillus tanneri]